MPTTLRRGEGHFLYLRALFATPAEVALLHPLLHGENADSQKAI